MYAQSNWYTGHKNTTKKKAYTSFKAKHYFPQRIGKKGSFTLKTRYFRQHIIVTWTAFLNLQATLQGWTVAWALTIASRQTDRCGQRPLSSHVQTITPFDRTSLCSMSCARSITLIFNDDGPFEYFRVAYVLADLYCATGVDIGTSVWLLLPIHNYCQLSHIV